MKTYNLLLYNYAKLWKGQLLSLLLNAVHYFAHAVLGCCNNSALGSSFTVFVYFSRRLQYD